MKSILALLSSVLAFSLPAVASDESAGAALVQAIAAAEAGDWPRAQALAAGAGDTAAADYVAWLRLRAGEGSFAECREFLAIHADWPGLPLLKKACEGGIKPGSDPGQVITFFTEAPATGLGALRLAEALGNSGEGEAAGAVLRKAWTSLPMNASEERAFVAAYGTLARDLANSRIDALLWDGETADAARMLPFAGPKTSALARVRIALRTGADGVDSLLAALPEDQQSSPGLLYERFLWRIRKDRWDDAAALIRATSSSAAALGRPEAWGDLRRSVARRELRQGRVEAAYAIASAHFLTEGEDFADLEWLSGWIALRQMNDPARALAHFRAFRGAVASPISLGRAGYWTGRALEAMGEREAAREAYAEGAKWQTSFYGLLAAERAGLPPDPALAGRGPPAGWEGNPILAAGPVRAGILLHHAGEPLVMQRFFAHMAETASPAETAALAALALALDRAHAAVSVSKNAANRGIVPDLSLYYPLHPLAEFPGAVPPALALAIARQESELNPEVVSHAGARGLMQLMPATANKVAGDLGLAVAGDALTSDWQLNARLGTTYLDGLIVRFGSRVMAIAAYNAGPHRVEAWIQDFGDPRNAGVDVIDWIEMIPFRETQNYVQRVLEGEFVYRARLSGQVPELSLGRSLGDGRL